MSLELSTDDFYLGRIGGAWLGLNTRQSRTPQHADPKAREEGAVRLLLYTPILLVLNDVVDPPPTKEFRWYMVGIEHLSEYG